jgi:prepilin-type processing-associated H-X9-DG protein
VKLRHGKCVRFAHTAFARIDLVTLLVFVFVFALILVNSYGNSQSGTAARSLRCLDNLRQLGVAWHLYTDANNGGLLTSRSLYTDRPAWVTGSLDRTSAPVNWDADLTIGRSPLVPYGAANTRIWRCPADTWFYRLSSNIVKPRVRSYSMSDIFADGLYALGYRTYARRSEIVDPAHTFVFLDEHSDSINDGSFAVSTVKPDATRAQIIDYPGARHSGACSFVFADGHAELYKWKGRKIQPRGCYRDQCLNFNVPAGDSVADIVWLSVNTSVPK